MTAGNRAVKAANLLRKRLRIYTATKNDGIARFETVTATARPMTRLVAPHRHKQEMRSGGPHDAGRRFALQPFAFRNLASTQASSPKAGNPKALSLKGG